VQTRQVVDQKVTRRRDFGVSDEELEAIRAGNKAVCAEGVGERT
jgi:hypothetical protein